MADDFLDRILGGPAPGNPMRAAQQAMRPVLPKRFWKETGVAEAPGGFAVTLDGRMARTPLRNLLAGVADRWSPTNPSVSSSDFMWNPYGSFVIVLI